MNSIVEFQQLIDALKSNIQADNVDRFQKHLLTIKDRFQDNTAVVSLVKMLQSLGKYFASQKNNAHKDAVIILDLIATQLTKLIQTPEVEKEQADEILSHCVHHFNKLKKTITSGPRVSDKEIQDLKSVIFAIDWEISDGTLKALNEVITRLMTKFKHHKLHYTFLKLINNVGQYLAVKKADAHTDSIPFLHSVFEHFEEIVEPSEIPLNEKKALLKRDIARFQAFSKGRPGSPEKASPIPEDGPGDDVIQPALSHITSPPIQASEDIPTLSVLSEKDTSLTKKYQETEVITPALAGKKTVSSEPRDVMDDLFTVKKTSADALLDAIHLGGDGGENIMSGQSDTIAEADGIKNITPQRMDTEPIPEIGSRLDQFFNLDSSENTDGVAFSEDEQGLDISDSDEGIVPYDDEISEEISKDKDVDLPQGVLLDLKNTLKDPANCLEQETVQKVNENISHLETLWEIDSDKISLLETISCLVKFIHKSSDSERTDSELVDSELTDSELTDSDELHLETPSPDVPTPPDDPPKGFWKRIKSVFFN